MTHNIFGGLEDNLYHHVQECGETTGMLYNHPRNSNGGHGKVSYKNHIGEVDALGNVRYALKSDESRTILIPLKYAEKALKIVNFALESKTLSELKTKAQGDDYAKNVYIPENVEKIIGKGKKIGSQKSRKIIDEIYFTTCLQLCNDELVGNEGLDRLNTIKNTENLKRILRSL